MCPACRKEGDAGYTVADGRKTEWPRVYSPISSGQQREIAGSAYNLTAID